MKTLAVVSRLSVLLLVASLPTAQTNAQTSGVQKGQSRVKTQQRQPATQKSNNGKAGAGTQKQDKQQKPAPKPTPKRIVSISGGRTRLNSRHWPLLGKPDAKYIFVEMFDYTCPHCRNTHRAVSGAFNTLKDDMAILALPVPLSSACNGSVRVTNAKHIEACELAKIAIAVWRCNPSKFHTFHDWMFESPVARTAFQARRHGEKLVGKAKLDKELSMPYASQYIAKHVEFYQRAGSGSVPKLLFPRSTINGEVTSPTTLVSLIRQRAQ